MKKLSAKERDELFKILNNNQNTINAGGCNIFQNQNLNEPQIGNINHQENYTLEDKVHQKWVPSSPPQILKQSYDSIAQQKVLFIQKSHKIQTTQLQSDLIKELKTNLKQETEINQNLRTKLETITRKQLNDKENYESENQTLTQKLSLINSHLQQLMQDNVQLKKKQVYLERSNKEYEVKCKQQESQITHLRQFVVHLTQDLDIYKKKDFRETQFWKNLQEDALLSNSEPPSDLYFFAQIQILYSPVPIDMNDKNQFLLRQEIERLLLEQRKNFNEMKTLTQRLEQSEQETQKEKSQRLQMKKESNKLIQQLRQQLQGAVRRINYLVEEKNKIDQENAKRSKYTAKLELKIVQENLNNKGLRQKVKYLKDEVKEIKVKENLEDFDQRNANPHTKSQLMTQSLRRSHMKSQQFNQQSMSISQLVPNQVLSPDMNSKQGFKQRRENYHQEKLVSNQQQNKVSSDNTGSIEDMFSCMERQVQAYYQLQRNIENGITCEKYEAIKDQQETNADDEEESGDLYEQQQENGFKSGDQQISEDDEEVQFDMQTNQNQYLMNGDNIIEETTEEDLELSNY